MGLFLRRLLLFSIATAISLVIAEVAWRLLRSPALGPLNNPIYCRYDPRLGWHPIPGARAVHRAPDFEVRIAINRLGFRDRERPANKAAGRRRILALGDSLTFGFGVDASETFSARLEERLPDTEVWNLGVCGYGTDQALELLAGEGLAYEPDVVLVTLCGNDVEENLRSTMYGRAKPRYRIDGDTLRLENVPVPRSFLLRWSHLYRSFHKHLWNWRRKPLDADEVLRGVRLTRRLLAEIARRAGARGAATVVVQTTLDFDVPDRTDGYHTLDIADALAGRDELVFENDPHWNAKGHAFVAERIAAFLRARGLVGP